MLYITVKAGDTAFKKKVRSGIPRSFFWRLCPQWKDLMVILAVIVLILKSPFIILRYLFHHKLLLVGAVITVIAFIAISLLNKSDDTPQMVQIPEYQQKAPDISKAPVVIATPSRVYYVSSWIDDGQIITLESFYFYDREDWEGSELPLPLDRNTIGEIKIYQR